MIPENERPSGEKSFDYNFDEREEKALRFLKYRRENFGYESFNRNAHDFDLLPKTFSKLYLDGSPWKRLNVDSVKHWAMDNGMSEEIADEMGYTCEIVYHTLIYVGKISRNVG